MILKRTGYFREMPYGDSADPSIHDFIGTARQIDNTVLNYLKNGLNIISAGSISEDIINPDNGIIGCPDVLTDGIYVWSADLAYYYCNYNLLLEEDFINHIKENQNTEMPKIEEIDFDNLEFI